MKPKHDYSLHLFLIQFMRTHYFRYCILSLFLFYFGFNGNTQTINGIDYSGLTEMSKTFDLVRDDVFGQRFASEHFTYKDEVTGRKIIALTTSRHNNTKMYHTHPQWTADGKYIVFTSNRTSAKENRNRQYYALSMENHEIVQITTGKDGREFHLGWRTDRAFQFKNGNLIAIHLDRLLPDSEKDTVKEPEAYEGIIAKLPKDLSPVGMALDAAEDKIYFASKLKPELYGIYMLDFSSGKTTKLLEVPFWVGHLQANPYKTNTFMYCWETRGDAPQRMWYVTVEKDGKVKNKALYKERANDWVTHEVFAGHNKVLFHLMGHLDRLQENQTGIFSIDTKTGETTFHGQTDMGGFWHCNATPDNKYIIADTFDGKLYRISASDPDKRLLLTQGHRKSSAGPFSKEAHMHPSVSPNGKWVLFNSSKFTDCDIMIVPIRETSE